MYVADFEIQSHDPVAWRTLQGEYDFKGDLKWLETTVNMSIILVGAYTRTRRVAQFRCYDIINQICKHSDDPGT